MVGGFGFRYLGGDHGLRAVPQHLALFLDAAFGVVDLNWQDYVEIDPKFYRPAEVDFLQADITKLTETIGWAPEISFEQLVREMVEADIELYGSKR